ncbi:MAG: hypothetical protein ACRERU_01860 [Methylococcales bacterium]
MKMQIYSLLEDSVSRGKWNSLRFSEKLRKILRGMIRSLKGLPRAYMFIWNSLFGCLQLCFCVFVAYATPIAYQIFYGYFATNYNLLIKPQTLAEAGNTHANPSAPPRTPPLAGTLSALAEATTPTERPAPKSDTYFYTEIEYDETNPYVPKGTRTWIVRGLGELPPEGAVPFRESVVTYRATDKESGLPVFVVETRDPAAQRLISTSIVSSVEDLHMIHHDQIIHYDQEGRPYVWIRESDTDNGKEIRVQTFVKGLSKGGTVSFEKGDKRLEVTRTKVSHLVADGADLGDRTIIELQAIETGETITEMVDDLGESVLLGKDSLKDILGKNGIKLITIKGNIYETIEWDSNTKTLTVR